MKLGMAQSSSISTFIKHLIMLYLVSIDVIERLTLVTTLMRRVLIIRGILISIINSPEILI